RTPSHLISNAQPVSSASRAPVTAFIGSRDSKATTPHFRALRSHQDRGESVQFGSIPGGPARSVELPSRKAPRSATTMVRPADIQPGPSRPDDPGQEDAIAERRPPTERHH